jgi:hypothetical protein
MTRNVPRKLQRSDLLRKKRARAASGLAQGAKSPVAASSEAHSRVWVFAHSSPDQTGYFSESYRPISGSSGECRLIKIKMATGRLLYADRG